MQGEPPYIQEHVFAIITTFRPDDAFVTRVERVSCQVEKVIIVDDGAHSDNVQKLRQWFSHLSNVIVIHNSVNVGLATSVNTGVSRALSLGAQWILTLDDDTLVFPMMLERLFHFLNTLQFGAPVGVIALSRVGSVTGPGLWSAKRGIITSGSLFSTATFECVKGFRENFFIDMVDYDFCLRIRNQGLLVVLVHEEGFQHSVGQPTHHEVLGKTITAYNHAPFRRYYIVRNSCVLIGEYLFKDPLFSMAVLFGLFKMLFKVVFLEGDKSSKLHYMASGVIDALRLRLGKKVLA